MESNRINTIEKAILKKRIKIMSMQRNYQNFNYPIIDLKIEIKTLEEELKTLRLREDALNKLFDDVN